MLEEQLMRTLIGKGAQVRITDLKFNKGFNFKGSISSFKADFSNSNYEEQSYLEGAICAGEGSLAGKDALKLLKKISQAKIGGILSSYKLEIFMLNDCGVAHLILDEECGCLRVPYTPKLWENEFKQKCEAPCKYQNICPSYQARKAGKALYLFG